VGVQAGVITALNTPAPLAEGEGCQENVREGAKVCVGVREGGARSSRGVRGES
jgi:hypothetical protein